MQIETLKVFCDLVDTTSFSQAADLNGVTQSAVSQQIRNLEKKYEVAFFERGKKNFSITPEGQAFDGVAREILELFKSIDSQLKEINDVVSGKLHIASVHSIGLHLMPPVVGMFKDSYPDVEVVIDYRPSNQVYIDVLEGRADLGLVAYPKPHRGVHQRQTCDDLLSGPSALRPPPHPDREFSWRKIYRVRCRTPDPQSDRQTLQGSGDTGESDPRVRQHRDLEACCRSRRGYIDCPRGDH